MIGFGQGGLFAVTQGALVEPQQFGTLQEVSVDCSFNMKELFGDKQFAQEIARGAGKFNIKAKSAEISANMFNKLFFGLTQTLGQTITVLEEVATIPATTPFTVTPANAATFGQNLGVSFAVSGLDATLQTGTPTAGGYAISGTTYTFAAAQAGLRIFLNYTYTVSLSGRAVELNNQFTGTTPKCQIILSTGYEGKTFTLNLYRCTSSKLGFTTKFEDFVIPDIEFMAMANTAGSLGNFSWAD